MFKKFQLFSLLKNILPISSLALLGGLLIVSCSYEYHLGQGYEKEGRFEESYEEYQIAYHKFPSRGRYKVARDRVALKVFDDLKEAYHNALAKKEFRSAHFLFTRALSLKPDDKELLAEKYFWFSVLIVGKLSFDSNQIGGGFKQYDHIKLSIDFQSPNQGKSVKASINEKSGVFIGEDFIYKPSFGFLSFYAIESIDIDYYSYQVKTGELKAPTTSSGKKKTTPLVLVPTKHNIPIIKLNNLRVSQAKGFFDWSNYNQQGDILPILAYDLVAPPKDWFFSTEVNYQAKLDNDKILISTNTKSIPFLPKELYINKKNQFFLLNFGNLSIQQFRDFGVWGLKRKPTDAAVKEAFKTVFSNIFFKKFDKYNGIVLTYEKEPNL
ncbi:MAG: hypothetical protein JJV97_01145 [SAR324 cluster bacterium]|nr:hypothetical protein [SAR324 cluster bacterium]